MRRASTTWWWAGLALSACALETAPPQEEPAIVCDADGDGYESEACGGSDCDDGSADTHPAAKDLCEDGLDSDCDPAIPACGVASMADLSQRSGLIPHTWYVNGDIANAGRADGSEAARLVWEEPLYELSGAVWTAEAPAAGLGVATPSQLLHGEDYGASGFTLTRVGPTPQAAFGGWLLGAKGDTDGGALPLLAGSLSWYDTVEVLLDGGAPTAQVRGAAVDNWIGAAWSYAVDPSGAAPDAVWIMSRTDSAPADPWTLQIDEEGALAELHVWRPTLDGTASIADLPEVLDLDAPTRFGGHHILFGPALGQGGEDLVLVSSPRPTDGRAPTLYGFPTDDPPPALSESPYQLSIDTERTGFGQLMRTGDVDGDGTTDLLLPMASSYVNGESSGALRIVFGPLLAGEPLEAHRSLLWLGENGASKISRDFPGDQFGVAEVVGDVNGDGVSDLVVGARFYDPEGSYRGAIYVFFGPVSEDRAQWDYDALIPGWYAGQRAGMDVTALGDLGFDGFDDFAVNTADFHVIVYGGGGT